MVSMMSIIEDTLKRKPAIEAGSPAKEFEREILTNEEAAVYMLRLRSNFLGAMALEKLAHVSEMGIRAKLRARYFSGATVDLGDLNISMMETYKKWLNEAVRVRTFLKSLGYSMPLDNNLVGIFNRMDIYKTEAKELRPGAVGQTRAKTEAELLAAINKFRTW